MLERWTHDRSVVHLRILRPAQALAQVEAQALLDTALPAGLQLPHAPLSVATAGLASLGGLRAEDAAMRTLELPLQLQAMLGAAAAAQAAAAHTEQYQPSELHQQHQAHQQQQKHQQQEAEGSVPAEEALAASVAPPAAAATPPPAAQSGGASSPTADDADGLSPYGT